MDGETHQEDVAHRFTGDIAVEAFTCLLIFKNMLSFGLTWSAYDWLLQVGILKMFYIIGSIQVAVCLLSIPMCKDGTPHSSFDFTADLSQMCLVNETGLSLVDTIFYS